MSPTNDQGFINEPLDNLMYEIEDGDVGTGLFGNDVWKQLNSGKEGSELDDYIEDIKASARVAIDNSIGILTPWFFSNMPQFYYQTTPREEKVRDLHAVITGHIFESKQKLQLWNRDRSKTTFLAPGNDDAIFRDVAHSLEHLDVKHGSMFTSHDRLLLIASFFTSKYDCVKQDNAKSKTKLDKAVDLLPDEDPAKVRNFMENLDNDMVIHATPGRLARMYILFKQVEHREDAVTHLIPNYFHEYTRIDFAFKKMSISSTLPKILALFKRYEFTMNRCILATVNQHTDTPVTILTFIVRHDSGETVNEKYVPFFKFNKAIRSLRWVDTDHFDSLWNASRGDVGYSLNEINLIRAIGNWVQIFLSKDNPYYYSEERILKTFSSHPHILEKLVAYFRLRFDPRKERSEADVTALMAQINQDILDLSKKIFQDIFNEATNFLSNILRTNYFHPRKTGLSFRMDPEVLDSEHYPNRPYGFFYLIGAGYRGFQVRYRDTARGGMRIIMPRDSAGYEAAFAGIFDEVAGLSYAQQLKNKDIPEGGAKAVLLLTPGADRETAAIGAVDSILNLITVNPETGQLDPTIIDYYGKEEYIFLGPDENVTNDLIEAFVHHADRLGYMFANAFMSSKPGAGINHKEYGVTSEGVNVYLDNMLPELGINPKRKSFTVKMTGGPDGDVAGNELKILYREYGSKAKVLAIGDGLGVAYDPNGLNWKELLRLVDESLSICEFNPAALSKSDEAYVIPADTVENIKIRNTMHATIPADIFIPAGGRPYTVNDDNWKAFLDKDGKPTVKAIVEGANIFFTEKARQGLQDHGVLIFKDSSANKCGVICSSFEIISSLILAPDEFMEIKTEYVDQVIEKLRSKADMEAKLMLREYHSRGKKMNLVEISKVLSKVINRVTDLVSDSLDVLSDEEFRSKLNDGIILNYVPEILSEKYSDRILETIPRSYRQAIISADTAARMVYAEGISFFENLPDEDIVRTVEVYLEKEQDIQRLLSAIDGVDLKHKNDIIKILQVSGARTLTMLNLSDK